jgi:DNA-binding transcriptional MerR regulator
MRREPVPYVPAFDYEAFPPEQIREALLHMRDLGQALNDLREIIDHLPPSPWRARVESILAERSSFEDDYIEIGFAHLADEAGLLRHVGVLGDLTPGQERRLAEFRADFERRIDALRHQAAALQEQWQRARRAYYAA